LLFNVLIPKTPHPHQDPPLEGYGIFPLTQGELSYFNSLSLRERIKVRVG